MDIIINYILLVFICYILLLAFAQKSRTTSCQKGYFYDKVGKCIPMLGCETMKNELQFMKELNGGFVKTITHVRWKGEDLAYSVPKSKQFEEDFRSGMERLESLQESPFVVEMAGVCYQPMQILTKFYKYGSLENLSYLLEVKNFTDFDDFKIRLQVTTDYLEIMTFLHHGNESGPMVMCDSNDLTKTLSQYLITDDFHVVLGDLDALPVVEKSLKGLIKCGHRQLFGPFVAPEQLWPFQNEPFDDKKLQGYDEKTDIWKIPDVVYHLLGNSPWSDSFKFRLFNSLKKCKALVPQERPTAREILNNFVMERDRMLLEGDSHQIDEL